MGAATSPRRSGRRAPAPVLFPPRAPSMLGAPFYFRSFYFILFFVYSTTVRQCAISNGWLQPHAQRPLLSWAPASLSYDSDFQLTVSRKKVTRRMGEMQLWKIDRAGLDSMYDERHVSEIGTSGCFRFRAPCLDTRWTIIRLVFEAGPNKHACSCRTQNLAACHPHLVRLYGWRSYQSFQRSTFAPPSFAVSPSSIASQSRFIGHRSFYMYILWHTLVPHCENNREFIPTLLSARWLLQKIVQQATSRLLAFQISVVRWHTVNRPGANEVYTSLNSAGALGVR